MKKNTSRGIISLIVTVAMMFTIVFGVKLIGGNAPAGANSVLASVANGTYTGKTDGFGGEIIAEVTIEDGKITDVKVTGDSETEGLGSVAVEKIPGRVLEAQSLDVDMVSGATVSSTAIMAALRMALESAGINPDDLVNVAANGEVAKTEETLDVDVVIVGAGGAGMAAAITAQQQGKKVLVVEKMPYVGGNTTKASGGMNAAGTKNQQAAAQKEEDPDVKQAILDSTVENYIADTMEGGHQINDIDLVTTMAQQSSDAIDWLESIGAPLPTIAATGGTVHYYLHEPEDGSAVGEYLVKSFDQTLKDLGVEVLLETAATEILKDDNGAAVGIKAESNDKLYTINAKAVILATGGFGANFELMASYNPALEHAVTTNTPAATGDGIFMAQDLGAATVDMEYIQLHPTVFQDNGLLVSERLRSNGAILINKEGNRFTNDLATRDAVSAAELEQPDAFAYIVYDSKFAEEKLYQKYIQNGLTTEADSIEELAKALGLEGDAVTNFVAAVDDWNKVCAGEKEDDFGRNNGLISCDEGPFFAIKIAPGIHHTMGGLKINTNTEVLDENGNVIPGLYAAGEVTGGVHGGNRIGGNAVADIVVYGRIAGQNASDYASK